ncbi:hypothetical protein FRC98_19610 [Lujinxingia vulgaris]|uniref:Imelysin-like domain-containing protein n=1 Tax=Lujinxingia vulgaris TaxID=2600176 RepID=A0A5C6X7R9_9DELT|nr:hypothetical protein [Lujinxingia vulgaris]TXD34065.1 hypothetical protein FRC98_19610 [Lujinxingia vulgaris]
MMTSMTSLKTWLGRTALVGALSIGALSVGATGCGESFNESAGADPIFDADNEPGEPVPSLGEAEQALMAHDVAGARAMYQQRLEVDPSDGEAAAGRAMCDLLLVPGMPEVGRLLTESLGAAEPLAAAEVLYGDEGLLYWASRGARWADDGQYLGIRSLLAPELPWELEELESITRFVEGLNEPGDTLARHLVSIANALGGLDAQLQVAIDDPDFVRFYVPGEVFHDPSLSLTLGRAELATIQAALQVVRAALYAVSAYEHSWTLDGAFGAWRQDVNLDDERYVAGYTPTDYTVSYLDARLFRRVAQPDRLQASRTALRDALSRARDALRMGLTSEVQTTLQWEQPTVENIQRIDELFSALAGALYEPTALPYSEPAVHLNLSSFFEGGRTLPAEVPWMVRTEDPARIDEGMGVSEENFLWKTNPEAIDLVFQQGVVEGVSSEESVNVDLGEGGLGGFIDALAGAYVDAVQDVYFTTR